MRRILLSPSWWLRHLLMVVLVLLFLRLGWWQFEKGRSRDDLQNLFYGIEWPFFAGCVIFGWWRMILDERTPPAEPGQGIGITESHGATELRGAATAAPVATGGSNTGGSNTGGSNTGIWYDDEEEDEELASYNRYLAALHAHDQQRSGR